MSKRTKYKSYCRKKQCGKIFMSKKSKMQKKRRRILGNSLNPHFVYPEIVINLTRQIEPVKTPIPVGLRKYQGMDETMDREGPWKSQRIRERTEGWLDVRLRQVSQVLGQARFGAKSHPICIGVNKIGILTASNTSEF